MDQQIPVIPPAKLFQHQTATHFELDNGMPVWYLYNPMVPLMTMKVNFTGGSYLDEPKKAGVMALTSAMLKEGSNGKTAQEISDEIEMLGASLFAVTAQEEASFLLQLMTQFFDQGLDLVDKIWFQPNFAPESLDRLFKIWNTKLLARTDDPDQLAKLAGNRDYFGDQHPYAISTEGYLDTVKNITLNDIKQRYAQVYQPGNATIILTGNMPLEDVKEKLNAHFGKLNRETSPLPAFSKTDIEHVRRLTIVDKPGAPQTVIRISQPAPLASDPKSMQRKLVNIPFGSSFTSRLMQNIREDKGYTYGAYAAIASMEHDGFMISGASVSSDVTGPALKEFFYELDRLTQGDFTQEEFDRAKATWQSELVQQFETQTDALAVIEGLIKNGYSPDAINEFARSLASMTLDEFNAIAREFPSLDTASITLVGDKATILEQIKGLDLPAPIFRDNQGFVIAE